MRRRDVRSIARNIICSARPTRRAEENDQRFNERHDAWKQRCEQTYGKAEVIVAKQRHGPTGIVRLRFVGESPSSTTCRLTRNSRAVRHSRSGAMTSPADTDAVRRAGRPDVDLNAIAGNWQALGRWVAPPASRSSDAAVLKADAMAPARRHRPAALPRRLQALLRCPYRGRHRLAPRAARSADLRAERHAARPRRATLSSTA